VYKNASEISRAKIDKANKAKELLENDLFIEAINAVEHELLNEFKKTSWFQRRKREKIWQQMQVVSKFVKHFENVIKSGRHAEVSELQKQNPIRRV
jgi:hypothetical protein